ncbi:MAG: squalene/phytoene synthase family protein [Gammaproteobacteria bacterium]|nr:squalene/phytoene synthase family protein [Gammaproteobacteria bacterium]NNF61921.1 squalene/phytoene synthase family protein [Gammaproteobacteria bacterium]NNM19775.1 squalene/phytoene synthase family protein [Gammaproteobacteria bacterium]
MPAEPATPAATYISAAIPPGSIDYYVALMTPARLRELTRTGIALAKVIRNVAMQPGEPQIRQLKLHWFAQEVEMVIAGTPRHPLTAELLRLCPHERWPESMRELVQAMMTEAAQPPATALQELLPAAHRAATQQALLAAVMPTSGKTSIDAAGSLGTGIALARFVRDHGAGPPDVRDLPRLAHEHFSAADLSLRHEAMPVYLQGALYRRQLRRLEAAGYNADKAALSPLALLWHSWREARKLLRP